MMGLWETNERLRKLEKKFDKLEKSIDELEKDVRENRNLITAIFKELNKQADKK